ncbi:putative uncharacterized protein CXorf58 homolog [Myotis myotis]|uniref:putative uncharacterized protein CXorf58 homolog n=1 Tax=Myotis myotis TaxID=51298 RepID=UPI00174A8A9A|nr:putative uncharacterized protein CXorf58 homolog [Myotis myotis]
MSGSSKAGATSDGKSADPTVVKGHKTPLPNTKKTKPVRPTRRDISALKIQRAWLSYMDRTIFQLLKHTICAAEYCVTYDILKNVSPMEAEFLKDAGNKCKVKFRFSGEKFPPFIVFKIFLHTGGYGYKYFSGKNMLKPSSKASYDAYKIMGRKKFLELILEDEYLFQKFKITDEIDIITVQDYVTYSSVLDKTPAYSGGRNNCWRRLSLKNIPKTMIMYDIIDYAESRVVSRRLRKEMKYLLQRPRTEEMRQNQMRIITQARYLPLLSSQRLYRPFQKQVQFKHLGRRSKQAKMKNEKMKKAYEKEKKASTSVKTEPWTDRPDIKQHRRVVFSAPSFEIVKYKVPLSDDNLEDKSEPFFWSQKLYVHRYPPF